MKFNLGEPKFWFSQIQGEIELLRAYVANVENQLEMGLISFVKSFHEEVIELRSAKDDP